MPIEQEAVIGSCFILAASAVLLVLADHPNGRSPTIYLARCYLSLVRRVGSAAMLPHCGWFGMPSVRSGIGFFYIALVVASVQLVGVYVCSQALFCLRSP